MIDFTRVGNNILVIAVLAGIGYMIYMQWKGQKAMGKLKDLFGGGIKK